MDGQTTETFRSRQWTKQANKNGGPVSLLPNKAQSKQGTSQCSRENGTDKGLRIKWLKIIQPFPNTNKFYRDAKFIYHAHLKVETRNAVLKWSSNSFHSTTTIGHRRYFIAKNWRGQEKESAYKKKTRIPHSLHEQNRQAL